MVKKKKTAAKKKTKTKAKAKTTRKKTTAKKAKKATKKKTTASRSSAADGITDIRKLVSKASKPRTKSEIMALLAESTGLSKKQVSQLFEALSGLMHVDLSKKGPGIFNVPGLMKITRVHKPATRARKGINPFTGEPMTFKAKPARSVVKVRALKGLKEMVN